MQIDKQQIMDIIRTQIDSGNQDLVGQAERELPQQVETENPQHQQLLQKLGIKPEELITRFTGSEDVGL